MKSLLKFSKIIVKRQDEEETEERKKLPIFFPEDSNCKQRRGQYCEFNYGRFRR